MSSHNGADRPLYSPVQRDPHRQLIEMEPMDDLRVRHTIIKSGRLCCAIVGIMIIVSVTFVLSLSAKPRESAEVTLSLRMGQIVIQVADFVQVDFNRTSGKLMAQLDFKATRNVTNRVIRVWSPTSSTIELDAGVSVTIKPILETCYHVHWTFRPEDRSVQDCITLNSSFWYGGATMLYQNWPWTNQSFRAAPFMTDDYNKDMDHNDKSQSDFDYDDPTSVSEEDEQNRSGNVVQSYWLSTDGIGLIADPAHSIDVSIESRTLCLAPASVEVSQPSPSLEYTVCIGKTALETHLAIHKHFMRLPASLPAQELFAKPLWSNRLHCDSRRRLSHFIDTVANVLPGSAVNVELDCACHRLNFLSTEDEVAQQLLLETSKNSTIFICLSPYISLPSNISRRALSFLIKQNHQHNIPMLISWNGELVAMLDSSSEGAISMFKAFMEQLRDGQRNLFFTMAGGQAGYIPSNHRLHNPLMRNLNYYSNRIADLVADFGPSTVTQVAYDNQDSSLFVGMLETDAVWSKRNGLQSVIPRVLTIGLLGYPFVLVDMMGRTKLHPVPSQELYIRWMQLCLLMPACRMYHLPSEIGPEAVSAFSEMQLLRSSLLGHILDMAKVSVHEPGTPIIRPLWWRYPLDAVSYMIDQEFFLGDRYLVAPVVHLGVSSHTVYLPAGSWRHVVHNSTFSSDGGMWTTIQVGIMDIPMFEMAGNNHDPT